MDSTFLFLVIGFVAFMALLIAAMSDGEFELGNECRFRHGGLDFRGIIPTMHAISSKSYMDFRK